jgi:hypothetical protein
MKNEKTIIHEVLIEEAYALWQKNDWTKAQFFDHLDYTHRIAVALGNLNGQVNNGGFSQWIFNGYKDVHGDFILNILKEIDGREYPQLHAGLKITQSVLEIEDEPEQNDYDDREDYEYAYEEWNNQFDEHDMEYYKLDKISDEMEEFVKKIGKEEDSL